MDTMVVIMQGGRCKSPVVLQLPFAREIVFVSGMSDFSGSKVDSFPPAVPRGRNHWLTIHGNVTYSGYYQSNGDSSHMERELHQHSVQTNLDITVKDRYPIRLSFSTNQGNSRLFRNFTGLGLQFTSQMALQQIARKARQWEPATPGQIDLLKKLKARIDSLKSSSLLMEKPALRIPGIQESVEDAERLYIRHIRDSLIRIGVKTGLPALPDSNRATPILADAELLTERIDSFRRAIRTLEDQYQRKRKQLLGRKEQLLSVLEHSKNSRELLDGLEGLQIPDSVLPRGYKAMLAVRSVGIGTTQVDYSELTARNIRIAGFQVEYNPSYYVAIASGAVDYRFRDFMSSGNRIRQYLNIARIGWGIRDGNNIILSYYVGRKQIYNFNTDSSMASPDYTIMGLSLEGRWKIYKHTFLVGELAKSSLPQYARKSHEGNGSSLVAIDDKTNTAWALSFHSTLPKTATVFTGMFKHLGANFQSFSLYASGSGQQIWMINLEQPFFRRQLIVTSGIRKNVYASLMEGAMYRSNTIFKSIQATFRRKRWPVLTAGYFPSVQIIRMGEGKFAEQLFNTLNGNVSYLFDRGASSFATMFSVSRFFNQSSDSNFVYFNSTNMMLQQTMDWKRFTFMAGSTVSTNNEYRIYGVESDIQYRIFRWLRLGGGWKQVQQTQPAYHATGYSGNAAIQIPVIGEISVSGEKSFVPGMQRKLEEVRTGRLTYTKMF